MVMSNEEIKGKSILACVEINRFAENVLVSRGSRIGSGMGMLLEALWGYYMNSVLQSEQVEIGWFPEHQYHDFVCLQKDKAWNPETREGEIFRLEVKSMNLDADESKGHFDVLQQELTPTDLLLIMVWKWKSLDANHAVPQIIDHFIGVSIEIAALRDALHLARGGLFVSKDNCPETCACQTICKNDGEPLNAAGKRERLSGPESARPSAKVSYAANFGGLIRMLKTSSEESRAVFRKIRREDNTAHEYISFIHRNYPSEEENQFTKDEWLAVAQKLKIEAANLPKHELIAAIRLADNGYREILRTV
jgi:hypothetical protein